MGTSIRRKVRINGEERWIRAASEQEYVNKIVELCTAAKAKTPVVKHNFGEYASKWFSLYSKPNIEKATAETYHRQLENIILPELGSKSFDEITVDDLQELFNGMLGAKSSKYKVRLVLNMIFNAAIEDGIISWNPLQSRKIRITGEESKTTKPYTVEQMRFLVSSLDKIQNEDDRTYLALQALHPLRLEEVLGLKWEDVDLDTRTICVRRAVTHPTRNYPEIKMPKTQASARTLGMSAKTVEYLMPKCNTDYILGGKEPYSYQQVKRMCERIRRDTGFEERITPIRFRTTVLTDLYDRTKDVKMAQTAAGHTTATMTLKHYIKGRESCLRTADTIDSVYCQSR